MQIGSVTIGVNKGGAMAHIMMDTDPLQILPHLWKI